MTQTYSQLQKKIAKLQKAADALRQKEVAGVVSRIKVAIEHYGLTARQLGLADGPTPGQATAKAKPKAFTKARPSGKPAAGAKYKYSNGNGQSWSGRGPRPRWLREAIAGGQVLDEFLAAPGAPAKAIGAAVKTKTAKRRPSTVLYRDGAGNSWTGRGPQPRWMKEAIAGGKTLEELKS